MSKGGELPPLIPMLKMDHDAASALVASLDGLDLILIADALDAIDPQEPHESRRASALAPAFRRAATVVGESNGS